jgi:hypothetical protein
MRDRLSSGTTPDFAEFIPQARPEGFIRATKSAHSQRSAARL